MTEYPVVLESDKKRGYTVLFPDLPYGVTQGETVPECLERAREVISLVLEDIIASNQPVPRPRRRRGAGIYHVVLPALESAKVELYDLMRSNGISRAGLARRMKLHRQQIDRLLDLGHASRLDLVEAAFAALGKRLAITVQDTA